MLGDRALVDAVLADYRTARITGAERALLEFVEKLNASAHELTQADVDRVLAAGWEQEAVHDAVAVCALFNFYNRWVDGNGIPDQARESYQAGGKRIASRGYVVTKEE